MLQLILAVLLLAEASKLVDSGPLREEKPASQEDEIIKVVSYLDSDPETLEELMTNENAVLEGDMVLSRDRNAVGSIWPTHVIPYVISPDLAGKKTTILSAMLMLSKHTCVSFTERTSEANYLHFVSSKGCTVGNIVHEILHSLGFHHEHTRMDREQYITVFTDNIIDGKERNFKKQEGRTFNLGYDVKSIMHYGSAFFSANGLPTIVSNEAVEDMGQRVKMTESDIKRVDLLYNCGSSGKQAAHDASAPVVFHDVTNGTTSAPEPEEEHTAAPSSSSVTLQ